MKVTIDIPMESYLLCMTRCGVKSPAYLMLKNGIVVRDNAGNEAVQILCDSGRARMILATIAEVCPESLAHVGQRIDASTLE